MQPYFVGESVARALFGGTLVIWIVSEARQVVKRRPEATAMDRGSRLVVVACWVIGALLASLAHSRVPAADFPANALVFILGLLFIWGGLGLRWWSIHTLGRFFTVDVMTSADQPVITSGPYRLLRHPSYAGLLLIFAGIGVLLANWLSLAALVVFSLIGLSYRIRIEEAALSSTLGDEYRTYAAGRKRLIPFLW